MFAGLKGINTAGEAALTIPAGRYAESALKRSREDLVTVKATRQSDGNDRIVSRQKHRRGAIQTQPQRKPFRRFSDCGGKHAMEMERRSACFARERRQWKHLPRDARPRKPTTSGYL